jgi:hypothetical protein
MLGVMALSCGGRTGDLVTFHGGNDRLLKLLGQRPLVVRHCHRATHKLSLAAWALDLDQ